MVYYWWAQWKYYVLAESEVLSSAFNNYCLQSPVYLRNIISSSLGAVDFESKFAIAFEPKSFFMTPITIQDLYKAVSALNNTVSSGIDDIDSFHIKKIFLYIVDSKYLRE